MKSAALFAGMFMLVASTVMASRADAQVRYGSVVVEVRDQSAGAVPGADVTVTQTETGLTRNSVSNDVGIASFATLPPGTYAVKVNLSGFKEYVTTGVTVGEDSVMRVSAALEVGQMTDTVTVSAGVAVLQTDRADVRTDIPATQLENVPVPIGRNYQTSL